MAEKAKPIIIKTSGKEYTLDFSRSTVVESQRRGFDAMALSDPKQMLVAISDFFFYSFLKNHPEITREEVENVLDEIGGDIDFVILDTAHVLPGENLDFLVALPYLKENAVICMHDVSECHIDLPHIHSHATATLFSAVTADKFLNLIMNDDLSFSYPNIAAFQINSDTMKNIENVFLTLILRWRYLPSGKDLWGYANMFARHYPQELFTIFMESLKLNAKSLMNESRINAAKK